MMHFPPPVSRDRVISKFPKVPEHTPATCYPPANHLDRSTQTYHNVLVALVYRLLKVTSAVIQNRLEWRGQKYVVDVIETV